MTAAVRLGPANPAAFWLSAIGVLVQVLAAGVVLVMYPVSLGLGGMMGYYGSMNGFHWGMMGAYTGAAWYWSAGLWLALVLVVLTLGILGVAWMRSGSVGRVRRGSVLVLVTAIAALALMWGFWIGSVAMFVGAVIGLGTAQRNQ